MRWACAAAAAGGGGGLEVDNNKLGLGQHCAFLDSCSTLFSLYYGLIRLHNASDTHAHATGRANSREVKPKLFLALEC